jgi:hypothetical protein
MLMQENVKKRFNRQVKVQKRKIHQILFRFDDYLYMYLSADAKNRKVERPKMSKEGRGELEFSIGERSIVGAVFRVLLPLRRERMNFKSLFKYIAQFRGNAL